MSNLLIPTQFTSILEIQLQFLIKWNPDDLSTLWLSTHYTRLLLCGFIINDDIKATYTTHTTLAQLQPKYFSFDADLIFHIYCIYIYICTCLFTYVCVWVWVCLCLGLWIFVSYLLVGCTAKKKHIQFDFIWTKVDSPLNRTRSMFYTVHTHLNPHQHPHSDRL